MAIRFCRFATVTVMTNGKKKCRCKLDGSIRNNCSEQCPHLRMTMWAKFEVWKFRRREAKRAG